MNVFEEAGKAKPCTRCRWLFFWRKPKRPTLHIEDCPEFHAYWLECDRCGKKSNRALTEFHIGSESVVDTKTMEEVRGNMIKGVVEDWNR